jgi:glycosyltransferase involved in cell wall biosynthesis
MVDGVFFARASTGIARVWRSILPGLARRMDVTLLDRGNAPDLPGVERIPFPSPVSKTTPPTATESIALQGVCEAWGADVFASTYYSTPLRTPALQLVYDMIPEVMGMDLSPRDWREKELAMLYARAHVCISANTRADLLRLYPEIDPARATVAHCGVDGDAFRPRPQAEVAAFRRSHGLEGPYLMMVGSRIQINGYKNGAHLLDALRGMEPRSDLTLLCVGGEPKPPTVRMGRRRIPVRRVDLSDDDLARAYSGAEALVYPSLYEGFGMPPAEAMASGCPVITTDHGSLREVVGDAALLVSGRDAGALRAALQEVRDPATRARLRAAGLERAGMFRWDAMADHVADRVIALAEEARTGRHDRFLREWAEWRRLQADVDFR